MRWEKKWGVWGCIISPFSHLFSLSRMGYGVYGSAIIPTLSKIIVEVR